MADGFLGKFTKMINEEYVDIWKKIATRSKNDISTFVTNGRRNECLWELLEVDINNILRNSSVLQRRGVISIALDDDKIWVASSGENSEDHFGLRYTTHHITHSSLCRFEYTYGNYF